MKVLLTGATGIVGTALRPFLADSCDELILTGRKPILDLQSNESFYRGDIVNAEFVDSLLENVDGVVHLAGLVGPDYTFEEVLGPNVTGTYNVFHAAQRRGITQIVNASSHHAVGFLRRGSRVNAETSPRGDSYYGITKAFGEILAAYFSDKFGLNILNIRIGYVGKQVIDERRIHTWCSPGDLAQLVQIGLSSQYSGFRTVYGVSNCPDPFFDNSSAEEIGYKPKENCLDFLADPSLINASPDLLKAEDLFIGGYFATSGVGKEGLARLTAQPGMKESK